jgi:hypothetical protein
MPIGHANETDQILEAIKADAERYLKDVVDESIEYYRKHSRRHYRLYNTSRIGIVVLSLSLPAIVTISRSGSSSWAVLGASVIPVVVAILAALDGFYRWGEIWMSRTSAQLTLRRIKREFWMDWNGIQLEPDETRAKAAYDKYTSLVRAVEDLMQEEEQAFWGRRIQGLKDRPS